MIAHQIAQELGVNSRQIESALRLLDDGATVPFIARYRKEATGGLDDNQLRTMEERLVYLRELEDRRNTVLKSIKEQGKLTGELEKAILTADTKVALEDLYRPYMPKRRTKAQLAKEAGLEPLAYTLLEQSDRRPEDEAKAYLNPKAGVESAAAALEGARFILVEAFAEEPSLVSRLRDYAWNKGVLASALVKGKEEAGKKFADYFSYQEPVGKLPSHRALALFRGEREGFLKLSFTLDPADDTVGERMIAKQFAIADRGGAADGWLLDTVRLAWRTKLSLLIESDVKRQLKEQSEQEAIKVFARNLCDLLLAAPAGTVTTMGLDPGLRTGVKVAVVDQTGQVIDTATIYPHAPQKQWDRSMATLAALIEKHQVSLISIGNGTASRETDKLVTDLLKKYPWPHVKKLVVSEAGASVYSASALASKELPDLDVSLRGAVSIARRLQDPLAELVKIEPKSIGVGQYQHDVNQSRLNRSLEAVVEDCVNAVGVEVNTASPQLLQQVAGLNATIAGNIVEWRQSQGGFKRRDQLLEVPRLGPKAYEQAAGFLRIMNGENPLDASAVHPEAYPVVKRILEQTGKDIKNVIGDSGFLRKLNPKQFVDDRFGEPTVKDIINELEKPGRDPRPDFKTAAFKEGITELADVKAGMRLEGVVTNVTKFGAFVDVGVHQDGLVHVSELANKFVSDPHSLVKAGDIVQVTVVSVDLDRKRLGLSMKTADAPPPRPAPKRRASRPQQPMTAMAEAFAKSGKKKQN